MKSISVSLEPEDLRALAQLSEVLEVPRAELARRWIHQGLEASRRALEIPVEGWERGVPSGR